MSINAEPIPGADPINENEAMRDQLPENGNTAPWMHELTGEATLNTIERQGRTLRVISAEHFSRRAAEFFQRDLADQIEDPTKWVFLIEGKDSGVHETVVASELAREKGIPVVDPIFNPYEPKVIQLYLNTKEGRSIPREIVIGQLASDLANAGGTTDLEEIATLLDVDSAKELQATIEVAFAEKGKDPDLYTTRVEQMREGLRRVSNFVSSQVLDYLLRQHPDRPEIAIYLGKGHEPILDIDRPEIPKGLRFSDMQIEQMLEDRKILMVRQILRANRITSPVKKEEVTIPATETEGLSSIELKSETRERLAQIIEEMPGLPPLLKDTIVKWQDNLFDLAHTRSLGFQRYLNSDNSLYQVRGAAALLAERVGEAKKEGRKLTPQEVEEVRQAFTKAAESRARLARRYGAQRYSAQRDELMEIAKGVAIIAKIIEKL